jgi:hypothetical protein
MKFCVFIFIAFNLNIASAQAIIASQKQVEDLKFVQTNLDKVINGSIIYWQDGSRIKLCHFEIINEKFQIFLKTRFNMSRDQYLSLWRRKLFTGRGIPPKQVKNTEELYQCILKDEHAVAIVFEKQAIPSINYLETI